MSKIADEFPEHRRWNNWLCYGFAGAEKRNVIRQEERDSISRAAHDGDDKIDATFWAGRLVAVYPELKTTEDDAHDDASYDSAALRRLLEDVAFAGADRALPSVM